MTVRRDSANCIACTAKVPAHADTAVSCGWDDSFDFNASLPRRGDGTFFPNCHVRFHLPLNCVTDHPLNFFTPTLP